MIMPYDSGVLIINKHSWKQHVLYLDRMNNVSNSGLQRKSWVLGKWVSVASLNMRESVIYGVSVHKKKSVCKSKTFSSFG